MVTLDASFESISDLAQHRKPSGKLLKYGTAGYRDSANSTPLDFVMFRVGCVIGLRSRYLNGQACGVMVTASHNEECDNGAKMVEPDGAMLNPAWEAIADEAINAESTIDLEKILTRIPSVSPIASRGLVFVGYDTRGSSERLVRCLIRGCRAVDATVENYGLLTTPVLHHVVRHSNGFGHSVSMASVEGYSRMLKEGITAIMGNSLVASSSRGRLIVDAAGGVGAIVFANILRDGNKIEDLLRSKVGISEIVLANCPTDANVELNKACGAEFAQKRRQPPSLTRDICADNERVASFDGDADRLVYSYTHPKKGWRLLDGDKIATLFALFLNTELKKSNLKDTSLSIGLVQTAYANGASTHFVRNVMPDSCIDIKLAKTGVKFVEHEAKTFDIGMYFEANGHGTVIFSAKAVKILQTFQPVTSRILGFYKLINQAVGDAISDCLAVETLLASLGMTVEQWDDLYDDLPSRQGKIAIADRTLITCTEDETRILTPSALQEEIDVLVSQSGAQARAFVRPSGTEDAARIYAEALTKDQANSLAFQVAQAAWRFVGKPGSSEPQEKDYL